MTTGAELDGARAAMPDGPDTEEGPTTSRLAAVGAVAVPPVLYAVFAWSHRWTSDDGFIFYRVVDQVVHGHGPVFQRG